MTQTRKRAVVFAYHNVGVRCLKVPQWRGWVEAGAKAFIEQVKAVTG